MGWFDFLAPDISPHEDDPRGIKQWVAYLIGAIFAIVVGMGVFYLLLDIHACFALMWSTFLIFLPKLFGTDGNEEIEHPSDILDVAIRESLLHGDGIFGDE